MQTRLITVLSVLIGLTSVLSTGCSRPDASGKLQIMYSGSIRGNVSPCG